MLRKPVLHLPRPAGVSPVFEWRPAFSLSLAGALNADCHNPHVLAAGPYMPTRRSRECGPVQLPTMHPRSAAVAFSHMRAWREVEAPPTLLNP